MAIDTADLRKTSERVDALRGMTVRVPTGSIFSFLGRK
jgi:hypothetical protein